MELVSLAGELLQTAAEHAASYRAGQTALRYLDKTLWVLENSARWAVPTPCEYSIQILNIKLNKLLKCRGSGLVATVQGQPLDGHITIKLNPRKKHSKNKVNYQLTLYYRYLTPVCTFMP
ncbi:hypothetical protein O3G_MSEX009794 [Manduca sexta]|uniref:Uncharacterized protein n=1 Tax=Manduca sexta TaxID=7130 RepID=A0A922CS98_MANSE|nr:hypothetical protein O3G_MSEX009794 [Manduca sexta]KAG6456517.1 hypothetical protein O3G_MSEX009794 [Manduca sexta]